jgi:hypothetical protein
LWRLSFHASPQLPLGSGSRVLCHAAESHLQRALPGPRGSAARQQSRWARLRAAPKVHLGEVHQRSGWSHGGCATVSGRSRKAPPQAAGWPTLQGLCTEGEQHHLPRLSPNCLTPILERGCVDAGIEAPYVGPGSPMEKSLPEASRGAVARAASWVGDRWRVVSRKGEVLTPARPLGRSCSRRSKWERAGAAS